MAVSNSTTVDPSVNPDPNLPKGPGETPGLVPNRIGNFGVAPGDISSKFPSPALVNYQPATSAPYTFTDPAKYIQSIGNVNTKQILNNENTSRNIALDQLHTELSGLEGFAPAAAALQKNLTSADNTFNQGQRTNQINTTLPGVNADLSAQTDRADAFASGLSS